MAITATVILGPRVFTTGGAEAPAEVVVAAGAPGASPLALAAPLAATGERGDVVLATPAPLPEAPPTTEATTPPTAEATTTTTAEEAAPTTTEAPAPPTTEAPTTTTTAAPPTTAPAPPPPPPDPEPAPAALSASHDDGTQEGMVSWYDLPGSRSGVCAHRTIERGTVVTVTNLDTGQSTTCTVDDRGPYSGDEKVLDLHKDEFSRLAPLGQGVFPARLDW